jgi:hypothetical protein
MKMKNKKVFDNPGAKKKKFAPFFSPCDYFLIESVFSFGPP